MWWRRKREVEEGAAVLAMAHAERARDKARARGAEVTELSSKLRDEVRRNHFGARIDQALAMRRHA